MTKKPLLVNENMPASKALAIMNEKKITSLLVVSDKDFKKKNKIKLKGIIHIHFLKTRSKMIDRKKKLKIIQFSFIIGLFNNLPALIIAKIPN